MRKKLCVILSYNIVSVYIKRNNFVGRMTAIQFTYLLLCCAFFVLIFVRLVWIGTWNMKLKQTGRGRNTIFTNAFKYNIRTKTGIRNWLLFERYFQLMIIFLFCCCFSASRRYAWKQLVVYIIWRGKSKTQPN